MHRAVIINQRKVNWTQIYRMITNSRQTKIQSIRVRKTGNSDNKMMLFQITHRLLHIHFKIFAVTHKFNHYNKMFILFQRQLLYALKICLAESIKSCSTPFLSWATRNFKPVKFIQSLHGPNIICTDIARNACKLSWRSPCMRHYLELHITPVTSHQMWNNPCKVVGL